MIKVLLVDDITDNIKVLQYELEDEGYQVLTATKGMEAVSLARSEAPDVILLDMMMPGMDGIETCKRLKADNKSSEVPIIMVSANADEATIVASLDAGAQDYITKPFSLPIVVARVRSAVRIKRSVETIAALNKELISLATIDDITGLCNRRYFNRQFPLYFSIAQRNKNGLSVFMIDVDHFKKYNDAYGHLQGDVCLKRVGATLSHVFKRNSDVVARYGGEEFVVVASGIKKSGAKEVTNRLIDKMRSLNIEHRGSDYGCLTVSVGYLTLVPDASVNPEGFINAADEALYDAKAKGRNRAVKASGVSAAHCGNSGDQILHMPEETKTV